MNQTQSNIYVPFQSIAEPIAVTPSEVTEQSLTTYSPTCWSYVCKHGCNHHNGGQCSRCCDICNHNTIPVGDGNIVMLSLVFIYFLIKKFIK